MKWLSLTLCLFITLSCSLFPKHKRPRPTHKKANANQFAPIRKKIALLTFFNESPYGGEDIAISASEEMRLELSRTGEFVLDHTGEGIFGSSKEIYSGGGVKLVQLNKKAKLSGLNFVLFGRIKEARVRTKKDEIGVVRENKSFAEVAIEMRVFDVMANKEIFNETFEANVDDSQYKFFKADEEEGLSARQELLRYSVRVAVRKSIPRVMELGTKLDWTGRVAKIVGSKIYLNAGKDSGLNVGDILRVMTEGREIFDPETGALIGMSKGEVKGTLEIIDYFGPDGAIAILHSGGSVTEGDFIQLY
ncbi:MAG: hypothetical protein ACOYL6_12590 [Bacteriovoracaceae bacterium]